MSTLAILLKISIRVLALFSENNPAFFSGTSSDHPSQDVGNQLQKQAYEDSGTRMCVGPPISRNPLDARQKAMMPLDGAQVTNNFEAPNFVPTNGLQLKLWTTSPSVEQTKSGHSQGPANTFNKTS